MMASNANQTRNALLDAAERLFSTRGYAAVGIREIAEAADANIASIKYHFGSKNELYLETVRRAMDNNGGELAWGLLEKPVRNANEAAVQLVLFVRSFLKVLIPAESTIESCSSLIFREALMPSEAIDAVVKDYIVPNNKLLVDLLRVLKPDADELQIEQFVSSFLGQILHIRIFRPFIERLRGVELAESRSLDRIAHHIAEFSLRGMGFDDAFIAQAFEAADSCDEATMAKEGTV